MSGFAEKPDYDKQAYEKDEQMRGSIFQDVNKQVDYSAQGDQQTYQPSAEDARGRITREASGATGVRSSSISRERAAIPASDEYSEAHPSNASRRAISPNRAMGARSVSIEGRLSEGYTINRGSGTIEGFGSSVDPVQQVTQEDARNIDERGRSGADSSRQRVVSPSRAMGARSVPRE